MKHEAGLAGADEQSPSSAPSIERDDGLDLGKALHRQVPPERWGINREDFFVKFVEQAQEQWARKEIPESTQHPDPSHWDQRVGPSMYQVNEYFIKPITHAAGGMSFALMCHPEGLPCDLFVSHAWCEGLFEFARLLRRAWPAQARTLWCCFLANPQCLDISSLLNVPVEKSPFALALRAASHFVVIPNSSTSIYTRLWCVYEIYEAVKAEKRIIMPNPTLSEVLQQMLWTYGFAFFAYAISFMLGAWLQGLGVLPIILRTDPWGDSWEEQAASSAVAAPAMPWWMGLIQLLAFVQQVLLGLCPWVACTIWRRALHRNLATMCLVLLFFTAQGLFTEARNLINMVIRLTLPILTLIAFGAAAGYDDARENLECQLQHTSVREASCSSDEDKERILAAISGREDDIDEPVEVLISVGEFHENLLRYKQQGCAMETLRPNPAVLLFHAMVVLCLCFRLFSHFMVQFTVSPMASLAGLSVLVVAVRESGWSISFAVGWKDFRVALRHRRMDNVLKFLLAWGIAIVQDDMLLTMIGDVHVGHLILQTMIVTVSGVLFLALAFACDCLCFGTQVSAPVWCVALLVQCTCHIQAYSQLPADAALLGACTKAGLHCSSAALRTAGTWLSFLLSCIPVIYVMATRCGAPADFIAASERLALGAQIPFMLMSLSFFTLHSHFTGAHVAQMQTWMVAASPMLNWLVLAFGLPERRASPGRRKAHASQRLDQAEGPARDIEADAELVTLIGRASSRD